jgi:hypothetical protein
MPHRKQELEPEQLHPPRYSQHRPSSSPFVSPFRRRSPLLLSRIDCRPCIFAKLLLQPRSPQHGASAEPIRACSGYRSHSGAVFFLVNEQSAAATPFTVARAAQAFLLVVYGSSCYGDAHKLLLSISTLPEWRFHHRVAVRTTAGLPRSRPHSA